ncbi:MAG: YggS family pyridoxal phosphate-dependent enzyme [Clostridia bacterium]|nr:YggS family pyridoxal phosphate-dependent enzyme [Clostridia bacterium]
MTDYSYIDQNYFDIKDRIEFAKKKAERIDDVDLLVAIKSASLDEIEYLVTKHGIKKVGENRVQQLLERYEALNEMGVEIHFIGALQTNKVKYIIDKVSMIHSIDRISLVREIDKQAKKHGIVMDVLIEINSGREENKSGVDPSQLEEFCREITAFANVKVRGFMTMGAKSEKNSEYLKYFCETYQLVLDILNKKVHNIDIPILSMGMSDSFEPAIEAGSTMVRIGKGMFIKKVK